MVMIKYKDMVPLRWLCDWTGMPSSNWYYQPKQGKRGRKPSTHTLTLEGESLPNEVVVNKIRTILGQEFITYGYEKVTWELQEEHLVINKKKVYRLMGEAHLLNTYRRISTHGRRNFVGTYRIDAKYPLHYLTMDIKYVYIHGEKRNVYLLTIMDVFTRTVLAHVLRPSIKQQNVILLLSGIVDCYNTKDIIIRNDNGSQFIAHSVRKYLKDVGMSQEFTHIATPQENAYIEALHSTLENEVIQRYWFDSIHHAAMKIKDYYRVYNTKRKHRSLNRMSPRQYWNNYMSNNQTLLNHNEISVPSIGG